MIVFKFKKDQDLLERLLMALQGSPAFRSNEVLLSDEGDDMVLIVGNENEHNLDLKVDVKED